MNWLHASGSFVGCLELRMHFFSWKQECAQAHLTPNVLYYDITKWFFILFIMGLQTQMPIVAREAMQMRGVRSGKYKIMGLCCACVVHLEERYSPAPAGGCHGRMQTQCSRSEEAKNQSFMRKQLATNLKKILYTQCRWNKTHQWAKIGPCLQPLLNNVASLEESNLISVSQYRGSISSLLATWVALLGHKAQVKALPCMWEKANVSRVLSKNPSLTRGPCPKSKPPPGPITELRIWPFHSVLSVKIMR